jgi:hypothetical protein
MMESEFAINPKTKAITFTLVFENDEDRENWKYNMEEDPGPQDIERFFIYEMHEFDIVDSEDNMDLTAGLIFTDGYYDWWDSNYAIESFIEELTKHGTYTFPVARCHRRHYDSAYEAAEYLEEIERTSIKFYTLYFPGEEFSADLLNKIITDRWVNGRIDRFEPETNGFVTKFPILDGYEPYDQPLSVANNLSALDCFIRQELFDNA